jgi:hypothetical protein
MLLLQPSKLISEADRGLSSTTDRSSCRGRFIPMPPAFKMSLEYALEWFVAIAKGRTATDVAG